MILKNLEKPGGDSAVISLDGITIIVMPQEVIKVPDDYEYDVNIFAELEKAIKPVRPPK